MGKSSALVASRFPIDLASPASYISQMTEGQEVTLVLKLRGDQRYALFYGDLADTRSHSHHAVEIFMGPGGPVVVDTEGGSKSGVLVVVDSDIAHRTCRSGAGLAVIMLDPRSTAAQAARQLLHPGCKCTALGKSAESEALAKALPRGCDPDPDMSPFEAALRNFLGVTESEKAARNEDGRIGEIKEYLNGLEVKRARLGRVARKWNLSESRVLHLFTKETGIPFRRYQLWLRLIDSVRIVVGGKSLTEAAHAAGFSDYAHLSRTFSRTFGYSLSSLFKRKVGLKVILR